MQENEASLKSFILTLLKYKYFIVGLTVFAIFVSGVLNFFVLKPVYSGCATVYLAKINGNLLLKTKDVQNQIKSDVFIQQIAQDLGVDYKLVKNSLSVNANQDSELIVVTFESEDKTLIKKFFDYFLAELNSFNKQAYETQLNALDIQKQTLLSEFRSLDKQASDMLEQLKSLEQKRTSNAEYMLGYSLLRSVYDSIGTKKVDLLKQIAQLDFVIKSSNLFAYQSAPLILDLPVKPHKVFNIVITGLVAFLLTIVFALLFEYWNTNT
ncbi:hypothetical protein [Caldisericum sp. AR60]|uniref:hypothetical protein n=1 Tax=Caldisericum sp. AR60 TaxID=3397852 RepID=UPI0039FC566F